MILLLLKVALAIIIAANVVALLRHHHEAALGAFVWRAAWVIALVLFARSFGFWS